MKRFQITIQSNENKNVSETHLFATSLPKNFLMNILCPLTKYQILIEEVEKCPTFVLSIEGLLNIIKDIKLKTKIAKNVIEVTKGNLGVFYKKPNFDLHIWTGDFGEVRTYINNINRANIDVMFPGQFKLDLKSNRPYFSGELHLDLIDNKFWQFHYIIKTHKIIYEEIILEK